MARSVHRIDLGPSGREVAIPEGATPIGVDHSAVPGLVDVWFLVDLDARPVTRRFIYTGTGHPVPEDAHHVMSTRRHAGTGLVWHVFEIKG
jgi:hypothetical protein